MRRQEETGEFGPESREKLVGRSRSMNSPDLGMTKDINLTIINRIFTKISRRRWISYHKRTRSKPSVYRMGFMAGRKQGKKRSTDSTHLLSVEIIHKEKENWQREERASVARGTASREQVEFREKERGRKGIGRNIGGCISKENQKATAGAFRYQFAQAVEPDPKRPLRLAPAPAVLMTSRAFSGAQLRPLHGPHGRTGGGRGVPPVLSP